MDGSRRQRVRASEPGAPDGAGAALDLPGPAEAARQRRARRRRMLLDGDSQRQLMELFDGKSLPRAAPPPDETSDGGLGA